MNDFTSMEEAFAFSHMGPMPPGVVLLNHIDQYQQGIAHVDVSVAPDMNAADFVELMERFQRTFRPDAKAPGGGDVLYGLKVKKKK